MSNNSEPTPAGATAEDVALLEDIFAAALAVSAGEERDRLLAARCGSDATLHSQVVGLLSACGSTGGFFAADPVGLAGGVAGRRPRVPALPQQIESVGDLVGPYKLVARLGEGGCGIVFAADQVTPLRRRVAVKLIKAGMDSQAVVARFEAERQAMAMMDHPGIARVFEAGTTTLGRPYFVMELVPGERITRFCDSRDWGLTGRLQLFIQVCHAVQHAHQKGIIHRDLKPSNILVADRDGVPVPKIIDFGIAKATGFRLTEETLHTDLQQLLGTPAYMSPEQMDRRFGDIDTRSDIYSLGVLLYELLTGHSPFDTAAIVGHGFLELQRTLVEKDPPRPSTRLSQLSAGELSTAARNRATQSARLIDQLHGDLDWIVMKCLEKDRARRYETANGLALDLQRFLTSEPVRARPPSTGYQLRKFARRNQWAFAAGLGIVFTLVAGIAMSTAEAFRANRERANALLAQQAAERDRGRAEASERSVKRLLYAANLTLMQPAWDSGNERHLARLLDDTEGDPNRGFEWYYWKRKTKRALHILRQPRGEVLTASFSPDGRHVVTAGDDWVARIWETSSGREIQTLTGHANPIISAAYSPDGERVATASDDQTARIWEVSSGRELVRLQGHVSEVTAVSYSPDGWHVVTAGNDQTIRCWDSETGREIWQTRHVGGNLMTLPFSPNGRQIGYTESDGWILRLDAETGRPVARFGPHGMGVGAMAFSPNGERVASADGEQAVNIWSLETGGLETTLLGHSRTVRALAYSRDGNQIATASNDHTCIVWETTYGRPIAVLRGHDGGMTAVDFSPDGGFLLTANRDGTARIWRNPIFETGANLQMHDGEINGLAVAPDGRTFVTASQDQTANVYDLESGRVIQTLRGHRAGLSGVAFLGDGKRIVTGSTDGTIRIWATGDGRTLQILRGRGDPIHGVAATRDGRWIASAGEDGTAIVWDAVEGREVRVLRGHTARLTSVDFSPDGQFLVTASEDGGARVWEVASGATVVTLTGHQGPVSAVKYSPDGTRLVTASWDRTLRIWDARHGTDLGVINGHNETIWTVNFSPDGRRIVSGGRDRTLRVWDTETRDELLVLQHQGQVLSAAFAPNGRRLITTGFAQHPFIWDGASAEEMAEWERVDRARANSASKPPSIPQPDVTALGRLPGTVDRWLVAFPVMIDRQAWKTPVLLGPLAISDPQIRPRAGDTLIAGPVNLTWRVGPTNDWQLDFNHLLGTNTPGAGGFAAAYVRSAVARTNLVLRIGDDDPTELLINGETVYRLSADHPDFPVDHDAVAGVALRAGVNVLLLKSFNTGGEWKCTVRFTEADGKPVEGLRTTLDPD